MLPISGPTSGHSRGRWARRRSAALVAPLVGLMVAGLLVVGVLGSAPSAAQTRTWVVDAVDTATNNQWVSADTGTSEVTIALGDTVEWQFDRATMDHDLTSQDTEADWVPPLQEFRSPNGAPIRYTFDEPGTYHYWCTVHGVTMRGTVVVEERAGDNQPPTATPTADPRTGTAPLHVDFQANAADADGDPLTYLWDFGTSDAASDTSTSANAHFSYTTPGSFVATLTVSDGRGGQLERSFPITVTEGMAPLPEIAATAAPSSGTAPIDVAFSTGVTTGGPVDSFADGVTAYPELSGTAEMVRSRDKTVTSLEVTGLKPSSAHMVHVHEQACGDANGGAHFRFDDTQPFAESNEIWLPFTTDAQGGSGPVEDTMSLRAGARAVSIVIHDPDNAARRIGCVDLAPSTADLAYAWEFGDGATGEGPDPDHTYTEAGTYTATVTVSSAHAGHLPGRDATETASVEVVVTDEVDSTNPRTTVTSGPRGAVRSHSATFRFSSTERGSTFECSLDAAAYRSCASPATLVRLRDGAHVLRVRAVDPAGNVDPKPAVRRWRVDTRRPRVTGTAPHGSVRDRTPTVRARVSDPGSQLTRRALRLRVDGRLVAGPRYAARTDRMTWTPRRPLSLGRHTVRLVVADAAGNRSTATWRFTIRR